MPSLSHFIAAAATPSPDAMLIQANHAISLHGGTLRDVVHELKGDINAAATLASTRAPASHTHAYGDLTDRPTLGTASTVNVSAFATAAQGALASTAVQPAVLSTQLALKADRTQIQIYDLPTPRVRVHGSTVNQLMMDGVTQIPVRPVLLWLRDAPEFLYLTEYQAHIRIERYRARKHSRRQRGWVMPLPQTHAFNDGSGVEREVSWQIAGSNPRGFLGPIQLANWFTTKIPHVEGVADPTRPVWSVAGEGASRMDFSSEAQQEGWKPNYHNVRTRMYVRFRVVCVDPITQSHVMGPPSETVAISAYPHPLFRQADGTMGWQQSLRLDATIIS